MSRPSPRRTAQNSKPDHAARGVAITAFLAAVAYWPGFTEPGNTARWIILSISLPILFLVKHPVAPPNAAHVLGNPRRTTHSGAKTWAYRAAPAAMILAWLAYAALSLAWTPALPDGIAALWRLTLLALAGAIGARVARSGGDLAPAFAGFGLGIAVNSIVVLAQLAGLTWFEQFAAPAGLFVNKNMLAESAVLAFTAIMALAAERAVRPGLAMMAGFAVLPSILFTASKTAFVALILTGCAWVAYGPRLRAVRPWLALGLALIALDALLLWHSAWPIQTLTQRLGLWRDTLAGAAWFGHGLGSFDAVWPILRTDDVLTSFHLRPGHPHADWVLLVSDLGIGSVFAFGLVGLVLWPSSAAPECGGRLGAPSWTTHSGAQQNGARAGQLTVVCFLATGLAAFPLENPASLLMAGLAAGWVLGRAGRR